MFTVLPFGFAEEGSDASGEDDDAPSARDFTAEVCRRDADAGDRPAPRDRSIDGAAQKQSRLPAVPSVPTLVWAMRPHTNPVFEGVEMTIALCPGGIRR